MNNIKKFEQFNESKKSINENNSDNSDNADVVYQQACDTWDGLDDQRKKNWQSIELKMTQKVNPKMKFAFEIGTACSGSSAQWSKNPKDKQMEVAMFKQFINWANSTNEKKTNLNTRKIAKIKKEKDEFVSVADKKKKLLKDSLKVEDKLNTK